MASSPLPKASAAVSSAYALRFISGRYQGGEYPLPASGEIVIGRSSELDMVLVEDMVSRRHARILVADGKVVLEDLGSTNGSFVNGERVQRAELNAGDRILIGTSIIKIVPADQPGSVTDGNKNLQKAAAAKRTSQVRTMTGSIAEIPLPDLLQLFSSSKKSGVLAVETDCDHGKIYLDEGRVVFAVVNDHYDVSPEKAFCRLITWTEGTFDMEPPEEGRTFDNPLDIGTEGLLMEAMRQLDEVARLDALPPLRTQLHLARPLTAKLRDATPEQLDVLQLAMEHGTVEGVLNHSDKSDPETGERIVELLSAGYLQAEG